MGVHQGGGPTPQDSEAPVDGGSEGGGESQQPSVLPVTARPITVLSPRAPTPTNAHAHTHTPTPLTHHGPGRPEPESRERTRSLAPGGPALAVAPRAQGGVLTGREGLAPTPQAPGLSKQREQGWGGRSRAGHQGLGACRPLPLKGEGKLGLGV